MKRGNKEKGETGQPLWLQPDQEVSRKSHASPSPERTHDLQKTVEGMSLESQDKKVERWSESDRTKRVAFIEEDTRLLKFGHNVHGVHWIYNSCALCKRFKSQVANVCSWEEQVQALSECHHGCAVISLEQHCAAATKVRSLRLKQLSKHGRTGLFCK